MVSSQTHSLRLTEAVVDPFSDWDDVRMLELRLALSSAPWHRVRYRFKTFKDGMHGKELFAWIQSCEMIGASSESAAIAVGDAMLQRRWFFQLNRRSVSCAFRPTSGQLYVFSDPGSDARAEAVEPAVLETSVSVDSLKMNTVSPCELSNESGEISAASPCQQEKESVLEKSSLSLSLYPANENGNENAMDSISKESTQINFTKGRLQDFTLALQTAPWHRVWYHYTAYNDGMTGEELAAWILTNPVFEANTKDEAQLVAEAMLHHGLFFRLNRLTKVCGFHATSAHQYVRDNPWGEAVTVSIEETLTLSLVSFEEVDRRRGNGPFNPVPRSFSGVRFDSIDELHRAIPLPSVHGTDPANCEWVDEWGVVFRSGDADGWRYGVTSDTCIDIELLPKYRYRRRVWQRAARVRPTLITGPQVHPTSTDSDTVISPVVSTFSSGRVLLMADSPELRRMVLQRAATSHAARGSRRGGKLEIFVTHAELSTSYQKLYVGVVDDPRNLWSSVAKVLPNTNCSSVHTFNYEWQFRFICESFDGKRPVILQLSTMAEPITRMKCILGHAELYLDGDLTCGKEVLKVLPSTPSDVTTSIPAALRKSVNCGGGGGGSVTDLSFGRSETKDAFFHSPSLDDKGGKYDGEKKTLDTGGNLLGYLHVVWKFTDILEADDDGSKNNSEWINDSSTRLPSTRSSQIVHLRVSIVRGKDLLPKPSDVSSSLRSFGQCLFPHMAASARHECVFEVAYSCSLCPLVLHSPVYDIQGTADAKCEFDWTFTVATDVHDPVDITLCIRRRNGSVWNQVGAIRLSYADEDLETSAGGGHLRRYPLGHGSVTLIHQWLPIYNCL